MTDEQTREIRSRFDEDLSVDEFERDYRSTEEAATQFFQDLFVQVLNFEETPSPLGDATWQDLPIHDWPDTVPANAARLFAEAGNFRVIYVELEKLTRTAERNAIQALTRSNRTSGWAIEGSFLTVFHASDEDIWHFVTPYEEGTDDITTGRPVLRRYTLGEGETHRTISSALATMDASKGRLAERIDDAFRVKPVTEDFYENYKSAFDTLSNELREKSLEIEEADRYAHMMLNRLMFFYYLQKKGWIGGRKDFVYWLHEQYEETDEEEFFHEKWLSALFFDGMNQPDGEAIDADLPDEVKEAVSGLPYMNGGLFQPTEEDKKDVYLSDAALNSVIRGFLEQYNFTVTEESPYDIDVAVDPAMLGKIYESLIAEQERGEAGIFYTPRVEVDLMCRMSLYEQFCDHLTDLDTESQSRIVEFIFSEPREWDNEEADETEKLEEILHELRIVDPACGSGAFLVGMKQVLTELYRKLDTVPDYHLKEQIINENLYGVDIKDWAVRVAEFRLWLSLVEGEDEIPDPRPVLPNFSFKLKVGDSLIQKLDGEFISLDTLTRTYTEDTEGLLDELKDLKREHFEGEADRSQEIEEKQIELLQRHIDGLIDDLSRESIQSTFSGETDNGLSESFSGDHNNEVDPETKERIENLKETREAIGSASDVGFFMWDIDFSDVIVEGGFDIVIGNPPYVRQEDIIDQGIHPERLDAMDDSEVKDLKKEYKNDLVAYVQDAFDLKPYKRSDIYVYFFFKGQDLLRDGGTLTYITSNSWLDVNYGQRLQEGLLRFGDLRCLLDNRAGPIFDEADVNTVITMAERTTREETLSDEVGFVTFNDYYENIVRTEVMEQVFAGDCAATSTIDYRGETLRYTPVESGRRVTLSEQSLWRLGGGSVEKPNQDEKRERVYSEQTGVDGLQSGLQSYSDGSKARPAGSYSGDEGWRQFLQAPNIYYEILTRNQELLEPVSDIAEVSSGLKTGANNFFYPDEDQVQEFGIPEDYLYPLVKTPRSLSFPQISVDDLDRRVLLLPEDPANERILNYIEWGEEEGIHSRSTVSQRDPWYRLGNDAVQSRIFWQMTHYTEHVAYYSDDPLYHDKRFYSINVKEENDVHPKELAALLNSTFCALVKVVTGRESSGRSIDTMVYEVARYLLPDIRELSSENRRRLQSAFDELAQTPTEPIYEEFETEERQRLDNVVFDVLGLDSEERQDVQDSVERLIKQVRKRDMQR